MERLMAEKSGYRQRIGRKGEQEAVQYLEKMGYSILERNFRAERGEVDIIAKDRNTLVFVEVKTKVGGGFGDPEGRVDRRKQSQIGKVAMGYLLAKDLENVDCRFDVVTVTRLEGRTEIRHIVDAFWLCSPETDRQF